MCAHVLPPHIHCQSWHRCQNCMCVQGDGWEMLNCTEWECRSCWSHCWCSCSWAHQSVGKLLQLAPASEEQQEVLLKKKIFKTLNKCCGGGVVVHQHLMYLVCYVPRKKKKRKWRGYMTSMAFFSNRSEDDKWKLLQRRTQWRKVGAFYSGCCTLECEWVETCACSTSQDYRNHFTKVG
jgi:hypothetical protein